MGFEEQKQKYSHKPVLLSEALDYLKPWHGGVFVDATLGLGGHSQALLSSSSDLTLIGLDKDARVIELVTERLKSFSDRFKAVHSDFAEIKRILEALDIDGVDGILADLGVSSFQLESRERGFSFRFCAPLDMRMDETSSNSTAADLLRTLSEKELADIIFEYGQERYARKIARRIVERRSLGKFVETTEDLVKVVESVVGKRSGRIHSATRVFQALRIAVNDELGSLKKFVFDAIDVLKTGGRLVVISFHSLEDRIVKRAFSELSGKKIRILTRKPIRPSRNEISENPRARSAKLRACLKL
ncbi:MAG: 16S rRNA (cytosine(1402)-N(4))-methyltransferase RsmH [Acidobacteriota bacterium]|nr:16S rRNA (cytosine(1402)-N(4))-methyltransferase RsmH [Pyrinomonadaceae bacterium]MDW8304354.1 16S rRNA (cytosine(1402)-N(4))-methyltransferase RsmH [Acidobacteriota bacterium]